MYLVTTALREFWPENGPIWLLSPGCSPNPDDPEVKGRWEIKGIVTDPFQNEQEATAAYAEIWRITNDLISLLACRLNVIHKAEHSERYWRTHIGVWALLFVTVVYDRRARLLRARTELDRITVIGSNDVNPNVPSDTINFNYEATDDLYNLNLYTLLCKKLEIPLVEFPADNSLSQPQRILKPKRSLLKNALREVMQFGYTALSSVFAQRADVLMVSSYLPRWFELALSSGTGGQICPLNTQVTMDVQSRSPINITARSALSAVPEGCEGITALVVDMLKMCLPKAFVEDYQEVCSRSDRIYKKYQPKAIYSANSWWYDETFKHWAAKCQEQGTKLIGGAHGGAAFIRKYGNPESFEILLSDHYLTWGWSEPQEPKLYPTPACKLINITRRSIQITGSGILYVGTAEPRHKVIYLAEFADYLEWQRRFFVDIPQTFLSKYLVRLHYADYGWKIRDRLVKVAPTLRFDSWDVSFMNRLKACRLYVCDHLSTTFAETLAANIPTVMFWNEARYPIRETATAHIQALKECHILHDTPESAAAWVAHVYDHAALWWLSKSCRKAVADFCYLYARTSQTPLKDWKRTFEVLATSGP